MTEKGEAHHLALFLSQGSIDAPGFEAVFLQLRER